MPIATAYKQRKQGLSVHRASTRAAAERAEGASSTARETRQDLVTRCTRPAPTLQPRCARAASALCPRGKRVAPARHLRTLQVAAANIEAKARQKLFWLRNNPSATHSAADARSRPDPAVKYATGSNLGWHVNP